MTLRRKRRRPNPRGLAPWSTPCWPRFDFASPDATAEAETLVRRLPQRTWRKTAPTRRTRLTWCGGFGVPRAGELRAAAASHAELEFMLAWPPGDAAIHGTPAWGRSILSGFIDRLYRDSAGRWHILDFKTNRVTDKTLPATVAEYEMQMLVYALAAEAVLKTPPASLVLHFLRTGDEHAFAWNDAARRRVQELVDRGIAAAAALR